MGQRHGRAESGDRVERLPAVEVIIPIHDASRPLARSIASLEASVAGFDGELSVAVVCHNITVEEIRSVLPPAELPLRFLHCADRLPSPAGPRQLALDTSAADYIAFLDSDDSVEPGALAAWLRLAEKHRLAAVIPRERHASGAVIRTPPVRPWNRGDLHPVKDRVVYRTAPLGLIRRDAIVRADAQFGQGLTNGSDQAFGLALWFDAGSVRYAHGAPSYVVGDDAVTRVTRTPKPLAEELKASVHVLENDWFTARSDRERQLIATKFVRVHLFDGVASRVGRNAWTAHDGVAAQSFLAQCETAAPGYARSLSIADRHLCDALAAAESRAEILSDLVRRRRRFASPQALLTRRPLDVLRVDAPLRFSAASAAIR